MRNIQDEDVARLVDICDSALILLKCKNIVSFTLNEGEHITIEEARNFTDEIFQQL